MTGTAPRKAGELATRLLKLMADGELHGVKALAPKLQDETEYVSNAAMLLKRRGLLLAERVGQYRLTDAGLVAARAGGEIIGGPHGAMARAGQPDDSLQGRVWWAIRYRRQFTIDDLTSDAERGEPHVGRKVGNFVRQLQAAGYLRGLSRRTPKPAPGKPGLKQYQLIRDIGPLTPVWRASTDTIFDPNNREVYPCKRS
jgi:hypothetical protein